MLREKLILLFLSATLCPEDIEIYNPKEAIHNQLDMLSFEREVMVQLTKPPTTFSKYSG